MTRATTATLITAALLAWAAQAPAAPQAGPLTIRWTLPLATGQLLLTDDQGLACPAGLRTAELRAGPADPWIRGCWERAGELVIFEAPGRDPLTLPAARLRPVTPATAPRAR